LPVGTVVQISGFTDSRGAPSTNVKLSQKRAYAVRQVLVNAGVNPDMLAAKGYGIFHPAGRENTAIEVRSNGTRQDHLQSERRVEFHIG
jgi:outer membrane protein OmpA-like peptidoglycan-associated protein